MANTQLRGQVFNHEGVNYLVIDDNDFSAPSLRVKSVDARREVREMPLENILRSVFRGLDEPEPAVG
jgi:hypothetical protein